MPTPQEFNEFISDCFNYAEVDGFCADYFRAVYDERHGTGITRSAYIRELIFYCERRDKLNDLAAALQKELPDLYAKKFTLSKNSTKPRKRKSPPEKTISKEFFVSSLPQEPTFKQPIPKEFFASSLPQELTFKQPIPMKFVLVKEGVFWMGSNKSLDVEDNETPMHKVSLNSYYIGKYPVTNKEYGAFAEIGDKNFSFSKNKSNHPIQTTWRRASDLCKWLSKETDLEVRLPTEAEWEKASRGITTKGQTYPWGNSPEPNEDLCNFGIESSSDEYIKPVGSYPKGNSCYECADMSGNVWEWCLDGYNENAYKNLHSDILTNPLFPENGIQRVVRGGSYKDNKDKMRCTFRTWDDCQLANGFRVVIVVNDMKSIVGNLSVAFD